MSTQLAISGGTPVIGRGDYANWPIIGPDDHRLINDMRRSKHNTAEDAEESYLVVFRIDSTRPLVGDYPL